MNTEAITKPRVSKVLVHWSEAPEFKDSTEYKFSEFEALAYRVAKSHRTGGYLKTKISVFFEGDFTYGDVRIDLADHDECGFRDHMEKIVRHADSERCREFYATVDRMNGEEAGTTAAFYKSFFDRFDLTDA
jgi:hypothetical protein